jgi:hypothetical protein
VASGEVRSIRDDMMSWRLSLGHGDQEHCMRIRLAFE